MKGIILSIFYVIEYNSIEVLHTSNTSSTLFTEASRLFSGFLAGGKNGNRHVTQAAQQTVHYYLKYYLHYAQSGEINLLLERKM